MDLYGRYIFYDKFINVKQNQVFLYYFISCCHSPNSQYKEFPANIIKLVHLFNSVIQNRILHSLKFHAHLENAMQNEFYL